MAHIVMAYMGGELYCWMAVHVDGPFGRWAPWCRCSAVTVLKCRYSAVTVLKCRCSAVTVLRCRYSTVTVQLQYSHGAVVVHLW